MLDIHSHILPEIDDGAKSTDEAIKILEMMSSQGITDVIATPHFYPDTDNLEDFLSRVKAAYITLSDAAAGKDLPKLYRGCELHYFSGISNSESLENFTLGNSKHLLLELSYDCIDQSLFWEILSLRDRCGITPIIAHIERYYKSRNYKKLLTFIKEEKIETQVNCTAVFSSPYRRVVKKLIKQELVTYIATDTHSVNLRPPYFDTALEFIKTEYSAETALKLTRNSDLLLEGITQVAHK